ncbi:MAG TPA: phage tail protein [Flavobacteriales bacterium]|nr:phage tail protein [Flavobacteriales bacterium]
MAVNPYPPVGFHFRVDFDGIPSGSDIGFQTVTGIDATVPNSETHEEGGENRFVHRLPNRATYGDLVLKRGMLINSQLIEWFRDAIERFKFSPRNITVTLLNEKHEPLQAWRFINAWPTKWAIDGFDAQNNGIMVDNITFSYQYFTREKTSSN